MRIPVCLGVVLALHGSMAFADAVVDMCRDLGRSVALCQCAADALRNDVGGSAYEVYEAVGSAYRVNQSAGQDRGDAWTSALKAVGASLSDTNPVGAAHRKAMKRCPG